MRCLCLNTLYRGGCDSTAPVDARSGLCPDCEKRGCQSPPLQSAIVDRSFDIEKVRAYLPGNFFARRLEDGLILIEGRDDHGWTLDGYVIPRLASGLIPAVKELR